MPARIGPKNPRRLYLRQWREYYDLNQQQVADRIGTTNVTISRWETASRPANAEAYAEALGVAVERLYQLPPPREPRPLEKRPSGLPADFERLVADVVAEVLRRRNIR